MGRSLILPAVLVVHLAVAIVHGATHGLLGVGLPGWQNGLVLLSTFVGPVVGVGLARRDHPLGVPLFTVSMAGALALGGLLHFLVENPDHVGSLPASPWRLPFQASAVAVGVTPTVGLIAGGWCWLSGYD